MASNAHSVTRRSIVTVLAVLAMATTALTACSVPPPAPGVGPGVPTQGFDVRAGIEQIYVTGAEPGAVVRLDADRSTDREMPADAFGSAVFRQLQQGESATVSVGDEARTVRVLRTDDHPTDEFYRATQMREGLNYIPMRDGTLLAAVVRPPVGAKLSDGPFPTVIEYSGYSIGAPQDPLLDIFARIVEPDRPDDPLVPGAETFVGSVVARLAGYTTVSVQMRGSGCSGGENDLFDLPSSYDGYDMVETIARQPWVLNNKPGMVGISFSGFSQIATAATRPPSLAAIAPMSFLGRVWDVGWPGGVFNTGFANSWLRDRVRNAQPSPADGAHEYANVLVGSDPYCRDAQRLRLQTRDGIGIFRDTPLNLTDYQRRDLAARLDDIDVPVFGMLQFQDEQTSSYAMDAVERLTDVNPKAWMTLASGEHNDAISPDTIVDLFQFLDIYVARRGPDPKLGLYLASSQIWSGPQVTLPFPSLAWTTLGDAQRRWEQRPRYTIGFERPGNNGTRWSIGTDGFPATDARTVTWHLGPAGTLSAATAGDGSSSYRSDPSLRPAGNSPQWTQVPSGAGVGFVSAPLAADTVVAGPVAADLWLSSTAADTDVQVTVTEVRPDGSEQFVSTGVQRAGFRTVTGGDAATPDIDYTTRAPLAPGANRVRVRVLPFAHAFRTGSRIRVVVGPTGGDRSVWRFASVDAAAPPTNTVSFGPATPSSISMPVVDATPAPGVAPCPSVGQPCRSYTPLGNGG